MIIVEHDSIEEFNGKAAATGAIAPPPWLLTSRRGGVNEFRF